MTFGLRVAFAHGPSRFDGAHRTPGTTQRPGMQRGLRANGRLDARGVVIAGNVIASGGASTAEPNGRPLPTRMRIAGTRPPTGRCRAAERPRSSRAARALCGAGSDRGRVRCERESLTDKGDPARRPCPAVDNFWPPRGRARASVSPDLHRSWTNFVHARPGRDAGGHGRAPEDLGRVSAAIWWESSCEPSRPPRVPHRASGRLTGMAGPFRAHAPRGPRRCPRHHARAL